MTRNYIQVENGLELGTRLGGLRQLAGPSGSERTPTRGATQCGEDVTPL